MMLLVVVCSRRHISWLFSFVVMVVEAIAAIVHNLRMLGVEDHVLDIVHLDVPIRIHGVPMDSKQGNQECFRVRLLRRLQHVVEVCGNTYNVSKQLQGG